MEWQKQLYQPTILHATDDSEKTEAGQSLGKHRCPVLANPVMVPTVNSDVKISTNQHTQQQVVHKKVSSTP